jgi:cupin superfamily acireductone dioxygenase involved in methionine salvage
MATISALPSSIATTITNTQGYKIPDLINTSTVEKRRSIQSIVIFSNTAGDTEYRILFGGNTIFQVELKQYETFTIENLKLTQLGDIAPATTNYDNTKILVGCFSSGTATANVVISFADITITN